MKIKEDPRPISKLFMISKRENELIKKLTKQLNTFESEVIRESLKEFFIKHGLEV